MTRIAGVLSLLVASQIVLVLSSAGLTHAAAAHAADVALFIALLAAPTIVGLVGARAFIGHAFPARAFWPMVAIGLAMRLVWFGAPAPMEDDFYRYLWDGAVVASGLNPYAFSPEQIAQGASIPAFIDLAAAGRSVLDRVNFPEYTSIYPGTAQLAFAAAHRLAPWSLDGLRVLFVLADTATLVMIVALLNDLGRSRMWAALYWCNPLVTLAGAATAHVDALLPPLVLGAFIAMNRMRPALASALLAFAVGVKIWPALLAPLLMRNSFADRRRLALAACVFTLVSAAVLAPLAAEMFSGRSGLSAYATLWYNNNAPFAWLSTALGRLSQGDSFWANALPRSALAGAGAITALLIAARPVQDLSDHLARALAVCATIFYLSPAQFPWYALWFLPLAAVTQRWPLLLASATLPEYYLFFPLAEMGERDLFQNGVALLHAAPVWAWLGWSRISPYPAPDDRAQAA